MTANPSPTLVPIEHAKDASRFLQGYAKRYHAGAFATPTVKEIAQMMRGDLVDVALGPDDRFTAVAKRLRRDSVRYDYTGRPYGLPKGSRVITHIARTPGSDFVPVEAIEDADYVTAYAEDSPLNAALRLAGRSVLATRVSAAAEILHVYGPPGAEAEPYPAYDRATVTPMPLTMEGETLTTVTDEVQAMRGWDDDFPYYSDGSWSSLSLKGFWPEDPARGIKPAEMPKSWKSENPADLRRECDWTVLAERAPALMRFIGSVDWWDNTERVRLLQMSGRGGKGGALGRHTDITDRDSGTRDGQITRFHLPLVTDPAIKLHTWGLNGSERQTHLAAGNCYYLDARKPHAVTNPTGIDRVHLVVDVKTDRRVRDLISAAYRKAKA